MKKKDRYLSYPVIDCKKDACREGNYIGIAEMMDEKTLVFTIFKNKGALFRIFQEKDRYMTQYVSKGNFTSAAIGLILQKDKEEDGIYKYREECFRLFVEIDPGSLKTIEDFTDGLPLDHYQQTIIDEKRAKKWKRTIKEGQQSWIPEPKGLMKSARENANPDERYYFFRKGETGHCSVCGHPFVHQGVRHKDEIECPHCRRILKAVNLKIIKTGRHLTYWRGTGLVYPQAVKGHLVLTEYQVVNDYRDGEIVPRCRPLNRTIFNDGKSTLYKRSTYEGQDYWRKTDEPKPPYRGMMPMYRLERFRRFYDRKALDRSLKRLKMNEYIKAIKKMIGDEAESGKEIMLIFGNGYDKREAGMLLKNRMYNLAGFVIFRGIKRTYGAEFDDFGRTRYFGKDVCEKSYDTVRELLGIEKKDIGFVSQNDLSQHEFILYKRYLQHGSRLKKKELDLIRENSWFFNSTWCDDLLTGILTKGIGLEKLINYVNRRIPSGEDTFHIRNVIPRGIASVCIALKDYWRLAEDNEEEVPWLPTDLSAAHAQQVRIAEEKKHLRKKMALREIVSRIRKLDHNALSFKASNGLSFVPFSSLLDIYKEGKTNHNCIYRNYINDYASGKDILLSIRKKENEPYFAMEIRNGAVIQVRGMMNRGPDLETRIALQEYISKKHLQCPEYIIGV